MLSFSSHGNMAQLSAGTSSSRRAMFSGVVLVFWGRALRPHSSGAVRVEVVVAWTTVYGASVRWCAMRGTVEVSGGLTGTCGKRLFKTNTANPLLILGSTPSMCVSKQGE